MTGTRLTIPEPNISLYKDGFQDVCKLGREGDGKKLSDLVERISEPMVIAVNAPWGAGKSVFLKCWVGAHANENNGSAQTVYFDAFKHDFLDDPLIGLTGEIAQRFASNSAKSKRWNKAKRAAVKLVRPSARIGLAVATAGATEVAGALADAAIDTGSDELAKAAASFWKKEDGKRAAMQAFRETLAELSAEQKLVVVVDELDRCRPDYALNLLEVIKHFFDVDNVHFVLGVNLRELENSVRARYGSGVNAGRYLQKFISVVMPINTNLQRGRGTAIFLTHFQNITRELGVQEFWEHEWLERYFHLLDTHAHVSLRDIEKIVTLAEVTPAPRRETNARNHLYIGALILSVVAPDLIHQARSGDLAFRDLCKVFNIRNRGGASTFQEEAHCCWKLALEGANTSGAQYLDWSLEKDFNDRDPQEEIANVILECFDVFVLPEYFKT